MQLSSLEAFFPVRILICNQKGGTGKTRTCMLLASALRAVGKSVVLEDHDPQQSLATWSQSLPEPFLFEGNGEEGGFVVIDTPPRLDLTDHTGRNLLTRLVQGADRILLVAELGGLELAAAKPMADFIQRTLAEIPADQRGRAFVLWNKIQARTKEGKQDLAPFSEYLGLSALRTTLPFLHPYHTIQYTGWAGITGEARARVLDLVLEIVA